MMIFGILSEVVSQFLFGLLEKLVRIASAITSLIVQIRILRGQSMRLAFLLCALF